MAKGLTKRVVLHRSTIDAVTLGLADGLFELAQSIVSAAAAEAPDSPYDPYPLGEGLPQQGGALAYVNGAKVAGWSQRGKQPKKPRAVKASKNAIIVIGGFGFPARFAERGTIKTRPQPFLSPTLERWVPEAPDHVRRALQPRLARIA